MSQYQNHCINSQERITPGGILVVLLIDIILAFTILIFVTGHLYKDVDNTTTYLRQYPLNSTLLVCNRTQTITDLIRIEKRLHFMI